MKSKRNLSFAPSSRPRPRPCPRVSPSRNHHAITLIRVSFIFRSPFSFLLPPFFPPSHPVAVQTSLHSRHTTLESTNFEVPVGFWCSHQLFPPCKIVNHALGEDKATNNRGVFDEHTDGRSERSITPKLLRFDTKIKEKKERKQRRSLFSQQAI